MLAVTSINLNSLVAGLTALFGLYVSMRVYRSASKLGDSRLLSPIGWLLAGLISSLCGFAGESATVIFAYMAVYWLSNLSEKMPKP